MAQRSASTQSAWPPPGAETGEAASPPLACASAPVTPTPLPSRPWVDETPPRVARHVTFNEIPEVAFFKVDAFHFYMW